MDFIAGTGNFIGNIALLTVCVIGGIYIVSYLGQRKDSETVGAIVGGFLGLVLVYPILAHGIGLG